MEKIMIKKGAWSPQEDQKLKDYVMRFGIWNWNLMPKFAGLSRTGKSCRLRWMNYLHPDVKRGPFTTEERETVIKMYQELGNRWAAIAAKLPGRTDNEVKNFFHAHLKKHLGLKTGPGKLSKATRCKEKNKTKLVREEKPVNICDISLAASSSSIITFDQNEKMDIHVNQSNPIIDIANTVILESNPAAITHHDYSHTLSIHSLDQFVDTTSFWLNLLNDADRLVD